MPQPQIPRQSARATTAAAALVLSSPAFDAGATLPIRHTADGDDLSPPLRWTGAPPGTASFALVCEDPDAPAGSFVHWLVWNIDAGERELVEGLPPKAEVAGIRQGKNGFGRVGWGGPSPPRGRPHRYVFRLYALDANLDLGGGARRAVLERALLPHVLAEATLEGLYGR
jgi:Raf kinase inhibitor-like YbhB/YbcL family protein